MGLSAKQTMLVSVKFFRPLINKNIVKILIFLIFLFDISNLNSNEKIINNFNNFETLKFNFKQQSFKNEENGVCYLKRPHFLKCIYETKNQKELIINNRVLVIYHKRYDKVYRYPLSKSYFLDILNKQKFSQIIENGERKLNSNYVEIKYSNQEKGEITFNFNKENYELEGWRLVDINNNIILFEIQDYSKNIEIKKSFFSIPQENQ